MKVLVTGGTGFIGSHLVDRLLEKGYDVRCIVRKSSNLRWLKDPRIEIYNGDFLSEESLKGAVKDTDYIYHVAGAIMAKNKQGYFNANQVATKNLVDATL